MTRENRPSLTRSTAHRLAIGSRPSLGGKGAIREDLVALKERVTAIEDQIRQVRRRIDRLKSGIRTKAHVVVNPSRCAGCGICERVCPLGAIRVDAVARIDAERCTGCGDCVWSCPRGALSVNRAPNASAWGAGWKGTQHAGF